MYNPYNNKRRNPERDHPQRLEDLRMQIIQARRELSDFRKLASSWKDLIEDPAGLAEWTEEERADEIEGLQEQIDQVKYLEDRLYDSNKQITELEIGTRSQYIKDLSFRKKD